LDKFKCDRCGACCRNIDKSIHFAEIDKGNGVCKYFNEETNLCTIYDQRPRLCNVDTAYEAYFQNYMSLEEYYVENHKACEKLRALINNKNK
jgi:Fe-S-cluster containining protein